MEVHKETRDGRNIFYIDVPDDVSAEQVMEAIRQCKELSERVKNENQSTQK